MKEMTEEERKAAVKMLRDRAKEILNDPVDDKREKLKQRIEKVIVVYGIHPFPADQLAEKIMEEIERGRG